MAASNEETRRAEAVRSQSPLEMLRVSGLAAGLRWRRRINGRRCVIRCVRRILVLRVRGGCCVCGSRKGNRNG
eukprot:1925397-Pleurochrysis_carterae.AAC.1